MVLEINDNIQIAESEVRLELAITLFDKKGITLGQAAEIAGLDADRLMIILRERQIFYPQSSKFTRTWEPVSLNMGKFPNDLTDFAVKPAQLSALTTLFEDEPSAEELCKML